MKSTIRWAVAAASILATGISGVGHAVASGTSETNLAITIHVRNYAGVASQTLSDAERVAAAVFRSGGVEIGWEETPAPVRDPVKLAGRGAITVSDIQLNILSDILFGRSDLPNNALGVAPGNGPGRGTIYVFDSRIKTLFWGIMDAHLLGTIDVHLSKGQILGHVIAHEIGHLLLNQELHSARGIMRGEWGFTELRAMARGLLLFTPQEAERMRAEIRSRMGNW